MGKITKIMSIVFVLFFVYLVYISATGWGYSGYYGYGYGPSYWAFGDTTYVRPAASSVRGKSVNGPNVRGRGPKSGK